MCYVLNSCTWRYLFIGHGQPKKVVYFVWFARCHARDVYAEELRYRGYLWTDFFLNRFKLKKCILNPAKHPEADSEPSRTIKMDLFPFVKSSILDLRLGSENTFVIYMKLFMEVLTVNSVVTEVSIFFFSIRSLSYRNQSIDLQSKSMDWFLCHRDPRHERVN